VLNKPYIQLGSEIKSDIENYCLEWKQRFLHAAENIFYFLDYGLDRSALLLIFKKSNFLEGSMTSCNVISLKHVLQTTRRHVKPTNAITI
jgi:hypothetical protein